ncbi:hypothetical protein MKMG_01288 [Methanogenium sp. MK-MG]|nr:hypothetical protein MKMG_01288 [Methanogenium sp. MK-MG]
MHSGAGKGESIDEADIQAVFVAGYLHVVQGGVIAQNADAPACGIVAVEREPGDGDIVRLTFHTNAILRGGKNRHPHAQQSDWFVEFQFFRVCAAFNNDRVTGHCGIDCFLNGRIVQGDDDGGTCVRLDADIGVREYRGQVIPCVPVRTHITLACFCGGFG